MAASKRLFVLVAGLFILNIIATVVAIAVNWPSQFGQVGTDASEEFLSAGTAISAPLLPVVMLIVVIALARRQDAWGWVAIVAAYAAAVMFLIGAAGEFVAESTVDTPKAVLVTAGVGWSLVALVLAFLATAAAVERRRRNRSAESEAV